MAQNIICHTLVKDTHFFSVNQQQVSK